MIKHDAPSTILRTPAIKTTSASPQICQGLYPKISRNPKELITFHETPFPVVHVTCEEIQTLLEKLARDPNIEDAKRFREIENKDIIRACIEANAVDKELYEELLNIQHKIDREIKDYIWKLERFLGGDMIYLDEAAALLLYDDPFDALLVQEPALAATNEKKALAKVFYETSPNKKSLDEIVPLVKDRTKKYVKVPEKLKEYLNDEEKKVQTEEALEDLIAASTALDLFNEETVENFKRAYLNARRLVLDTGLDEITARLLPETNPLRKLYEATQNLERLARALRLYRGFVKTYLKDLQKLADHYSGKKKLKKPELEDLIDEVHELYWHRLMRNFRVIDALFIRPGRAAEKILYEKLGDRTEEVLL